MPPPADEGRIPGLLVELPRSPNLGPNLFELLAVEQSESSSPDAAGVMKPRTVLIAGAPFFMPRFFFLAARPVRSGALAATPGGTGFPFCCAPGVSSVVTVLNRGVMLIVGAVMVGQRV